MGSVKQLDLIPLKYIEGKHYHPSMRSLIRLYIKECVRRRDELEEWQKTQLRQSRRRRR